MAGVKIDGNQIVQIVGVLQQLGLLDLVANMIKNALTKKAEPKEAPLVPGPAPTPGIPGPIPAPSASTPVGDEAPRKVARVGLVVQKAVFPDETLYEGDRAPMKLVNAGENFNFGSSLWLDLTAYDENGDEWMGHSLVAADLDYRTRHEVYKDGVRIAFIQGQGGEPGNPADWTQQNSEEVSFAQRAWKDSIGFNARTRFHKEGTYVVVGYVNGVESNRLTIRVS